MKKFYLIFLMLVLTAMSGFAQRTMDKLDRGLVAVKTNSGVFCTWRIFGEEYYDVTYNIYRDGTKLNTEPLTVSNYTDGSGSASNTYQVEAIVRGVAQAKCTGVKPWSQSYLEITPDHGSLTSTYVPNDACCADVDGDGEMEILLKFDNASWAGAKYQKTGYNGEYFIMEVYKLNGKKLWWIDWGPNMADFQNNEQNIVAYDWDQDGKAEAVLRASDGTKIHTANGQVITIGDASKNYLASTSSGQWFVYQGAEYLLYLNGETGEVYDQMEYPLKRLENGETSLEAAWGDGYGHRSTKHFFGAPYLDGRKPSIFLARGIYTQHKMIALDVDPSTHKLSERWRWNCKNSGSPWYGQGYHNYGVADVDWDGRDEIVFGSMVIDDNGSGLSTTGLGHGDAQHCSDFNPYMHGQEIFTCNEDRPNNNYRDATTSKIYYRSSPGSDDGRSMCGNFSNQFPGALGASGHDRPISTVYNDHIPEIGSTDFDLNFRIYWDGDLLEETLNGSGANTTMRIHKMGNGNIETLTGSLCNNDTKATPCYQGDVLGDWREEVIARTKDNTIRIYTTTIPTEWRNYTLWHDMQYRQAMVWQMCGYNQPPHTSYFLGELEGITMAPPALTMTDRTEVKNGGSIDASYNDKQVLMAETNNMSVSVANGVAPYIFFDNAPTWVQGHDDNNNITTETYTHTLTGGAFSGTMRLVKQGDGALTLPNVTQTYSGPTDIWAGVLNFDGTMQNSRVWLNRFAELNSNGGKFQKGIEMDYASVLRPGGANQVGTVEVSDLKLNFGARIVMDVNSNGTTDKLKANALTIETKDWKYGPEYNTPVIEIVSLSGSVLEVGTYELGEVGTVSGNISDIEVAGLEGQDASVTFEGGKLKLVVKALRDATSLTWNGSVNSDWNLNETENFKSGNNISAFVSGDAVEFNDDATQTTVNIVRDVYPASVTFNNNSKDFTFSGKSISGDASMTKNGSGGVVINNVNKYTGFTYLNDGKVTVAKLANNDGVDYGAFGGVDNKVYMNGGTLVGSQTLQSSHVVTLQENGGTIEVLGGVSFYQTGAVKRQSTSVPSELHKTGDGTLSLGTGNAFDKLYIDAGTVNINESGANHSVPNLIIFNGSNVTVNDVYDTYSYSNSSANWEVPEGCTGTVYLDGRCNYKGRLTGKGTLHVYAPWVRNFLQGDWSKFEGTLVSHTVKWDKSYDPVFSWENNYGLPKATLNISSGTTFTGGSRNLTLGNLVGSGVLSLTGVLTVGGINEDIKFNGTFDGRVNVIKDGDGAWTFSKALAANEYTFRGGEIRLNNTKTTSSLFGSATATVQDQATMVGQGTVGNISFNSGAVLHPGDFTSTRRFGSIKSTGNLNMAEGSKLILAIYSNTGNQYSRSWVVAVGNFDFNGELNIELGEGFVPGNGDEFVMWTAGSFSGTPTAIHLPELPEGLYWDTTDLLKPEGKLRVTDQPTGIQIIRANGMNDGKIYTLDGKRVEMPLKKGVYIMNGKKFHVK